MRHFPALLVALAVGSAAALGCSSAQGGAPAGEADTGTSVGQGDGGAQREGLDGGAGDTPSQPDGGAAVESGASGPGDDAGQSDASLDGGGVAFVPADPFTIDTSLPHITFEQLVAYFAPGTTTVQVGTFSVTSRTRQCADVTGCSAWTAPSPVPLETIQGGEPTDLPCASTLITGGTPQLAIQSGSIVLTASGPVAGVPAGAESCTQRFTLETDTSDAGAQDDNGSGVVYSSGAYAPSGLWFPPTVVGGSGNTDGFILFDGRVNADGTFQFVSVLGAFTADTYGANEENQIALYGKL